ncbi:hypothetical protein T01_3777 [Trichinella spiralis]|uniref:FLYWCH-type domain-containing protein n=2 Tax=Trichinella spiralis TaxID=6334 RepID=A0A0V1ASD0_TRISP|nr:hypothetical protein T01_3777 [Trichinella spiralis]
MADDLHLFGRSYNLFYQGKVYQVKHTNIEDKQWVFRQIEKGCRGSIHTNLDVDAVLSSDPHADDCTPDRDILYKMEKKNSLKRRAAEELKTVPQISHEEASSASADLETAGQFPTYKCVKTAMYRKRAQKFPRLPPTRQQLEIPPQWRMTKSDRRSAALGVVRQPQTVICDSETALIPAL